MTAQIRALYEERERISKELFRLRDIVSDTSKEVSAEDEGNWKQVCSDFDAVQGRIEKLERAEAIEKKLEAEDAKALAEAEKFAGYANKAPSRSGRREKKITDETAALALQAWSLARIGTVELRGEHHDAARAMGINLSAEEIEFPIARSSEALGIRAEYRAQSVGTTTAGGYTVPQGFVRNLEKAILQFGSVRRAARILRTAEGNDLPWPTVNDTGNKGALIAENTQDSEQDVTFGQLTLGAYKYTSKIVRVSVELLQDSAFDMASELGTLLGERIGRITEEHYTTGTGSSQPNGVVTASTLGKTAASGTAITADEVIDLVHSVDPGYRQNGRFMLHDTILATLRKLKDSNGLYLWQPNLQLGIPPTLYGYGYEINMEMDSTLDVSSKVLLFGDFSKYLIRDVRSIRLKRLVERYAEYDQEGFIAYFRTDSDLLNAGTNPIKHLITAAA